MYDIETGDIFVSRDVIFQENIFPFFESMETETSAKILTDGANFLVEHDFEDIQNGRSQGVVEKPSVEQPDNTSRSQGVQPENNPAIPCNIGPRSSSPEQQAQQETSSSEASDTPGGMLTTGPGLVNKGCNKPDSLTPEPTTETARQSNETETQVIPIIDPAEP